MEKNDFRTTDREFAFDGELGALYSAEHTTFRVWAPLARNADVLLYRSADSAEPAARIAMEKSGGVWSAAAYGDLHGTFYTFEIDHRETIDIYARSAGANGLRGMITDMSRTNPDGWDSTRPVKLGSYTDAVIYELHVRDFSSDESGGFRLRGKFGAFCEKDVKNDFGDTIGLDYIADLGITHIHLLPVADYQSIDETDPNAGFNWGYDPLNYNIPEGSYTTDPDDGTARVREFKELIMAAHKRGIGIIMDVVYNHTYSSSDSPFERTFPGYYYRREKDGSLSNGSGCGNEFASERVMASKFICDSLCYLAREYRLDGFRFDLMGLTDIVTLKRCAKELRKINPDIILYGEGWTGGCSPLSESRRAVKRNARKLTDYAFFSDDFRDCVKGSVFDDRSCGYVNGYSALSERMKSVMSAGLFREDIARPDNECWTDSPQQAVNYVEAHDNLTLFDKLTVSMPDASADEIVAADKMAAALVFLSQGIPFIQAGQEFLRSKPDPDGGFVHDSYNSPDSVNALKWNSATRNREIVEYYKGLIGIRKRFPVLRQSTGEEVRSLLHFEQSGTDGIIAHIGELLLMVNPTDTALKYEIGGTAEILADGKNASPAPLYSADEELVADPHSILLARIV